MFGSLNYIIFTSMLINLSFICNVLKNRPIAVAKSHIYISKKMNISCQTCQHVIVK